MFQRTNPLCHGSHNEAQIAKICINIIKAMKLLKSIMDNNERLANNFHFHKLTSCGTMKNSHKLESTSISSFWQLEEIQRMRKRSRVLRNKSTNHNITSSILVPSPKKVWQHHFPDN